MTDHAFIDATEPLDQQNARLLKITEALIRRVERDTDETGNAYSLFQRAVALEGEVRARTQDLQRTLGELSLVNDKLEAATAIADEANRAKTRFLAAASHDVLQPLNAAKLFLGTLETTDLDARQQRITGRVRTAFNSVEALLGALLDISKLDSAGASAEVSTFSIAQILDPIAVEFAPIAEEKDIRFSTVPSSVLVHSDPSHLRRILQNLVSNAVRYCESGRVVLGCRRRGTDLRIEVFDTGPGIAEDDIPSIFREFYRLKSSAATSAQGMGLGLAIVERACRLLNHPLEIQSTPGIGSRFTVSVPVAENTIGLRMRQNAPALADVQAFDGVIALVLGSQDDVREPLVRTLEHWGASVIAVTTPQSAIHASEQLGLPPDAILICDALEDPTEHADALCHIRDVYQSAVPAVFLGQDERATLRLSERRLPDVSFVALNQVHRLRALLTWSRDRILNAKSE